MMQQHTPVARAAALALWQPLHQLGVARVAIVRNPFESVTAEDFIAVHEGAALQDLAPRDAGAWTCQVDDRYVSRAHWHYAVPPGALVVFREHAQGGNSGKQSLRVLLQIALQVALNVILPGAGTFAEAAFRIGATFAGNMAINALIPLDATNIANNDGGPQQFSGQVQQNIARLGQPIPEIMGFDHGWPDLAAQPYATYAGNEQYLHVILCIGRGQYQIDAVSIGDTPLTSFAEAEIARCGPAQTTLTGPGTGHALVTAQTLANPLMTVADEVSGVELQTLDYAGPYPVCRTERTVSQIHIDMALPLGLDAGRSITWRVELQNIDDFGASTGPWVVQATETYNTASAVPVRLSYSYTPATTVRKRCRLLRTDTRSTADGSRHDITWLGLRATIAQPGHLVLFSGGFTFTPTPTEFDRAECTFIAIKIRVSGQLSGVLRFRVRARRMLRTWTGSAWTAPVLTRNPAWALARVLQARGVPDAQVDLAQLLTLANTWTTRQDNFDHRFDAQLTTWDALAMIARVGNAVPLIRGSKYTFARDEPQAAPAALFGMRNIKRGSFSLAFVFPESDPMTTLDLEYWDHRRWGNVTVTAQLHNGVIYGYRGDAQRTALAIPAPDPLARGNLRMPGVIGEKHAIRIAVRLLAEGLYRRMVASYTTELDGLLPAPLQLIVLQHDVGNFGQGGEVALWTEGTLTIGTTEPLAWEPGANHYVRLMRPDGRLSASIAVLPGATDHDMVLAAGPGFTPIFDDAGRERTRYVFGAADNVGALAKVRAIVPRSATDIEHRVVLEDDRVHTADSAWLPSGAEQDPLGSGVPNPDADGGSARVVNLTDHSFNILNQGAPILDFRIDVHNDGRFSYGAAGGPSVMGYWPNEWLNPQTVTAAIAALYEVKVDSIDATGGDSVGAWLSLGTSRFWSAFNNAPAMTYSAGFTVSIRDVATQVVQDVCTVSYSITDNSQ